MVCPHSRRTTLAFMPVICANSLGLSTALRTPMVASTVSMMFLSVSFIGPTTSRSGGDGGAGLFGGRRWCVDSWVVSFLEAKNGPRLWLQHSGGHLSWFTHSLGLLTPGRR